MNRLKTYIKNKRLIIGLYLAPAIAAFSIALVMMPGIHPKAIDSIANSTADVVIGQPDMNSNLINQAGYGRTLYDPGDVHIGGGKVFIADRRNNRIMVYNGIPTGNNALADVVIGQPDMLSVSANQGGSVGANTLNTPAMAYVIGTKLLVLDTHNNRVLIYNSIPASNNASADVVIGQNTMTSGSINQGLGSSECAANTLYYPNGIYSDGTKLVISDFYNNRVLIYNNIPTNNNASADVVIGQANFTSNSINQNSTVRANTLYYPGFMASDGTRLFVADYYNNRVLIYNSIPVTNNASADAVIGQVNLTSNGSGITAKKFNQPNTVFINGTNLFVSDFSNHRVLIYNNISSLPTIDASANIVIGQADFISKLPNQGGAAAANTINFPAGVSCDGTKLLVTDNQNHRVLIFNSIPTSNNASADLVIGQPDFTHNGDNQSDSNWVAGSTSYRPQVTYSDGTRLFIADRFNHRVLIYNTIPTSNNVSADIVIGQADLTSGSANRGGGVEANTLNQPEGVQSDGARLFVADTINHRVLIYNSIPTANGASADVVIGQADMTSGSANRGGSAKANTLNTPEGFYFDGTKLFIADRYNNRILIYNSIPTANGASADVVIGQQNFTSSSANQGGGAGANTLYSPTGVYSDGTRLFVADSANNRVLIYNTIPTISNTVADVVIGQADMTSVSANRGRGVAANTLGSPAGIYGDGTRLFIAEYGNHRVLIYNAIPSANGASADIVIGQQNFTSNSINQGGNAGANTLYHPTGVNSDGKRLFVGDYYNNRILIYDLNTTKPVISEVKFDGSGYVSGDTIRTAPVISATMTDIGGVGGIEINNLKITIDSTLYTYASFDASTDNYNSMTGIFNFKVKNTLSTGTHNIRIEISDYLGNWGTFEANNLNVNDSSGTVQMDGIPLNYPNPFKALTEITTITYKLTIDGDILVYIFDVRGVLIKKATYSSGSMGGKAGYNEVTWNGKDDFGSTVGNGIYPYRIVSGGRVLGRGKIAVLD